MIVTANGSIGMFLASPTARPVATAAPLIYCGPAMPPAAAVRRLPLTSVTMPPPPIPIAHPQQQQQHCRPPQQQSQNRGQPQQKRAPAVTTAPLMTSATDSAYASQYASRYASAVPSGAASRSVSPVRSAARQQQPPVPQAQRQSHQSKRHLPQQPLLTNQPLNSHQSRIPNSSATVTAAAATSDSSYASRTVSALHSRATSPSSCSRIRLSSATTVASAAASGAASASASAMVSAAQSRRASRAVSPTRPTSQRASPYAVVLPRGQTRLLDEAAAAQLCRRSLREELDSAVRWLGALDWSSAAAFEAASDEAAVMEDEFRSSYDREPPPVASADSTAIVSQEEAESHIVLADTLLSMVEAAWSDCSDQEGDHELRIGGKAVQAQQRSSKPKKEDAIYNVRYKTLPCLHWQKNRTCPAGDHCHFAHGPQELRQPQRHPKFKTQVCQNYKRTGSCVFGSRCFFKHTDE